MRQITWIPRASKQLLLPLGVYLLLACGLFAGAWSAPAARYIGLPADSQAVMWYLKWFPLALTHGLNPLVSNYMGYPEGFNIMWYGQPLAPAAMLLWPVTTLFGVVVAYNLISTLALALSAWTAYLLFRPHVRNATSAIVGGALYGFGPYMAAHSVGHVGLTFAVFPPLAFLILDRILFRRTMSPVIGGLIIGTAAALQVYMSEEILATTAIAVAVVVAVALAIGPKQALARVRPAVVGGVVAVAAFIPLSAPGLVIQFLGPHVLHGVIRLPGVYVNDLLNYIVPTSVQMFHPPEADALAQTFTGNIAEWNGYIGLPLILLLGLVAAAFWRRYEIRLASIAALVIALFSLGPEIHVAGRASGVPGPWRLVHHIPLLEQVLPARLTLYFFLAAGLMVAVFVNWIFESRRGRLRVAGAALVALAMVSVLPQLPYKTTSVRIPSYFSEDPTRTQTSGGQVVLIAPFSGQNNEADPVMWQAASGIRFKMPEGYFLVPGPGGGGWVVGPTPTLMSDLLQGIEAGAPLPVMSAAQRRELQGYLRDHDVTVVVVGPTPHQREMIGFFTALFGTTPATEDGAYMWRR